MFSTQDIIQDNTLCEKKLVDLSGIEPLTSECKSDVLPLAPQAHVKFGRHELIRTDKG